MTPEDKSVKEDHPGFQGELVEPLEPIGLIASEAKDKAYVALVDRKMRLLLEHFQIKRGPHQWYALA